MGNGMYNSIPSPVVGKDTYPHRVVQVAMSKQACMLLQDDGRAESEDQQYEWQSQTHQRPRILQQAGPIKHSLFYLLYKERTRR